MYLEYWGLARPPFADERRPLFYEGETQAEALARMRFVVRNGRRASLLTGVRGVGKSLVLRQFAEACRRDGRDVVLMSLVGLSIREFFWQLAAQLAAGPRLDDDAPRLFRRIADFASTASGVCAAIVLLDDVDQAGPDVQMQLVRLLSLGGDRPWMTLLLATPPRGVMRLGENLLASVELRIELEPWTEAETTGYVQHALIESGCERPAFDDEALSALYSLTDGVARRVNRLADHALLGAAAEGLEQVNAGMIEAAHDALKWTATA